MTPLYAHSHSPSQTILILIQDVPLIPSTVKLPTSSSSSPLLPLSLSLSSSLPLFAPLRYILSQPPFFGKHRHLFSGTQPTEEPRDLTSAVSFSVLLSLSHVPRCESQLLRVFKPPRLLLTLSLQPSGFHPPIITPDDKAASLFDKKQQHLPSQPFFLAGRYINV